MQLRADELRARLEPLFRENFEKFGELGAAISLWQNGELLLNLHGGFRDARREQRWTEDTIVGIWSATKGLGSACLLHVLQHHKIDIE
jgi:CubicO group peptidase (beta-lactamase class C family)